MCGPVCSSIQSARSATDTIDSSHCLVAVARDEPLGYVVDDVVCVATRSSLEGALPDCKHAPAGTHQSRRCFRVLLPVSQNFRAPETNARAGPLEQMTIVTVPETPVNLNDRVVLGKNHVRLAR